MKPDELRAVAEAALLDIASTRPGHVRASIRGVVASALFKEAAIIFRRKCGVVGLEVWPEPNSWGRPIQRYPLPPDLEAKAGAMLDRL